MSTASIRQPLCCVSGLKLLICDQVELDISGQSVFGHVNAGLKLRHSPEQ